MQFVCDKAFEQQTRGLVEAAAVPVMVRAITAGKFRRYVHLTFFQHLTIPKIVFGNMHDSVKVGVGFLQSIWLLLRDRPDIVFAKGGFVCLPLGMATRLLRIPLVIHDSDTRPGLTNRVLARWASRIATGAPLENYHYPAKKSVYTGVPIAPEFSPFTEEEQREAKRSLGVSPEKPLIVVTGGSLGAESINSAIISIGSRLLDLGYAVYHVAGKKHYESVRQLAPPNSADYIVEPFVYGNMSTVLGAADVVVCRGSATTLQELAGLQKAAIVVPAHQLSDQVKNGKVYQDKDAAIIIDNKTINQTDELENSLRELIDNPSRRAEIARNLHRFARPNAATDIARIIIETASGKH